MSPMSEIETPAISTTGRVSLLERARRLYDRRETIRFFTTSELKAAHRDMVLGRLWGLLDPLFFMLVYTFIFGVLFRQMGGARPVDLMMYILIGVLLLRLIEGSSSFAALCIRANRGIIHEINFPKAVFPIAIVFSRLQDFLIGLGVLIVMLLVAHVWPTLHYLWLPYLILVTLIFTMGVAMFVAYCGAFFADTTNVLSVALRLLFFLSPTIYFVRDKGQFQSMVQHPTLQLLYMANPIAALMECFRDVLLWRTGPEPWLLAYASAASMIACVVGFMVFNAGEGKFAKYV